ncbi:MAG: mycoredoxin [Streptomyces sp.]|nr:mycoredoxin [Streptomyces sp.]
MNDSTTQPTAPAVHVYWRPGCPYCMSLRHGLERTGLPVQWHNIWDNDPDAAYVRSINQGNETVPTVDVAGTALTNPSTRQVLAEVRARAPHLLPPGDATPKRSWLPWRRRRPA